MINEVYVMNTNISGLASFLSQNTATLIAGIITTMGIMIGILLLPSLRRFKVGSAFEAEIAPMTSKSNIEMEILLAPMDLIQTDMPLSFPMQLESFHMALQIFGMPVKYPLKSINMPVKSIFMPETHDWLSSIFLEPQRNVRKKRTKEQRLRIL
jgi:hypothetical protein